MHSRAHPRSRGENVLREPGPPPVLGSSPLTRGKHGSIYTYGAAAGLIPAHAGKTACAYRLDAQARAHPRSRGENGGYSGKHGHPPGSSPLTRGKLGPGSRGARFLGLIPAHAGKTRADTADPEVWRAHPRSRGENEFFRPSHLWMWGSSPHRAVGHHRRAHPRSRGENRAARALAGPAVGSSPLTRGKLAESPVVLEELGAHPRSRGEN